MDGYSVTLNSDKNEVTINNGWHDFYQKSHHPKPFSHNFTKYYVLGYQDITLTA